MAYKQDRALKTTIGWTLLCELAQLSVHNQANQNLYGIFLSRDHGLKTTPDCKKISCQEQYQ